MHRALLFALALATTALLAACGDTTEPAPPTPHAPATPPPAAPTLETLAAPLSGHATAALPARVGGLGREGYEATPRSWTAKFGRGDHAAQIQLGDRDAPEHATLAFYGNGFAPGRYDVGPATDEFVAAHAGGDQPVFTVEIRVPGHDLRSLRGTVELTAVDDTHVTGTFDIVVKEVDGMLPITPSALGRFDASYDRYIEGWINSESTVRAQLRDRARGH